MLEGPSRRFPLGARSLSSQMTQETASSSPLKTTGWQ
ncbi:hypothetical protein U0070_018368 [Myodes glareolus]|uniref:Uncharacterized protein n=1 Tax=Myodes glareolus TaxID=447135 RepID=A0AAW0JUE8_MYOGA